MNFLKHSKPRPSLPDDMRELQNFLCFGIADLLSAARSIPRNYPDAEDEIHSYEVNLMGALIQPHEKCLSPLQAMSNIFKCAARLQIHFLREEDPRKQLEVLEGFDPETIASQAALLMLIVRASSSDSAMLRKRARFLLKSVGIGGFVDWADAFTQESFPGVLDSIDSEDEGLRKALFGE